MSDINFQPIFDYIDQHVEEQITELKQNIATKADIQRVLDAVDGFARESKKDKEELAVINAKAERIENWVIKAAEKTNIPYKP